MPRIPRFDNCRLTVYNNQYVNSTVLLRYVSAGLINASLLCATRARISGYTAWCSWKPLWPMSSVPCFRIRRGSRITAVKPPLRSVPQISKICTAPKKGLAYPVWMCYTHTVSDTWQLWDLWMREWNRSQRHHAYQSCTLNSALPDPQQIK